MIKRMKLIYYLFLLIIIALAFFGFGYMHEQVHVQIYESYDIESEVYYLSNFPDFVTVVDADEYYEKCDDYCKLAHNINEAVGYHLMIIFAFLIIAFFVIVVELYKIQEMILIQGINP